MACPVAWQENCGTGFPACQTAWKGSPTSGSNPLYGLTGEPMHEFGLVSSLIDAACEAAAAESARRVTRLVVRIGSMRQIDDRLLVEAFDLLRDGTVCADASLNVIKTRARASCRVCGTEFDVEDWIWQCGKCGADGQFVGGGDELELVSIDAEVDE